jgi:autotransporter translocation and assembly factor TamB
VLDFSIPDVGALAELAQQEAEGELSGKINFTRDNGVPRIAVDATAPNLSRAGIFADHVALNATIADYLHARPVSATAFAASIEAGGVTLENVDASVGQSGERVDLKVHAIEREGGVLSKLLGLPGNRLLELAMSGEGPLAAWRGNGTLSMDGGLVSTLALTHTAVDAGRRITLQGDGPLDRFLPDGLKPLLAGGTDFDLTALLGAAGRVEVENANVRSPAFIIAGRGGFEAQGASDFSLQGKAVDEPVTLSLGNPEAPLSLLLNKVNAHLSGPREAAALDLSASLGQIAIQGNVLQGIEAKLSSQAFDMASRSGPVALEVTADSLTPANPALAPMMGGGDPCFRHSACFRCRHLYPVGFGGERCADGETVGRDHTPGFRRFSCIRCGGRKVRNAASGQRSARRTCDLFRNRQA